MSDRDGAAIPETVEWRSIDSITPHPENPRVHTDEQVAQIAASLETFGWTYPILVDEGGQIIAGHGRMLAAQKLGMDKVPVIVAQGWTDEQIAAYRIIDNRLTEQSDWDTELLAEQLADLGEMGFDMTSFVGDWGEFSDSMAEGGDGTAEQHDIGSLMADYGHPPFSVFDTQRGEWQARKRMWQDVLGVQSDDGRADNLTYSISGDLMRSKGTVGTSIFDPVLAELMVRWFSAPGHHILDPFAGGSVRGIVSGYLGRAYTGIDLRPEQIDANIRQAEQIIAETAGRPSVDDPDAETPVQHVESLGVWIKRDDALCIAGVRGGKVRSCNAIIMAAMQQGKVKGVVTAGSRSSPQVAIVAFLARKCGLKCRVHVPSGEATPEISLAHAAHAEVIQHTPGYNSVIVARAREDALKHGWLHIPFGMECQEAVDQTAAQVRNIPDGVRRIVMPVGSGMSLAGVLHGLRKAGRDIPVLGVMVGADPTDRLDKYAPEGWRDMVGLIEADADYHDAVHAMLPDGTVLDPHYEAKAWPHVQEGDLFWCVGVRPSADTPPQIMPRWIVGDSAKVLPTLADDAYDMILTCPPYGDLEVYSDDPNDLSTMDYDAFTAAYSQIMQEAMSKLKDNRFAVVVVGEYRLKHGGLASFMDMTVRAMEAGGARYYNDAILINAAGTLPLRARAQFVRTRKLGRMHQYVLVFVKGDPKEAAIAAGIPHALDMSDDMQEVDDA